MSNYDLRDAFQELVALNEAEEFNLSDEEQIKKMADFMDGDEYDEVQMVIDVDAEGMDDLEPSYEGKIILQCPVCKSLIYKDEADIVEDSESDYVNIEEHCPYCKEEGGMIIVGKVAPYPTHEEEKVEEPADDSAEEPVESEEETEVEIEEPVQESLTEEVGVQKFGDEDDPERYHSANWYIGGRNNFELSTDALGGAKRGDAVRYTASRWSHTYHNIQEMEDDIKNLQTLIAEVKKLEAKGFVNSELNESLNEDANGELAMAELKDLVAMHIYNRFLESLDDNMAQEIAHRIPEYDVDWCNEEGDNFLANAIETKKKALARAITDALFANAPRELPECLTESDMPAEESENIIYKDSRRNNFYLWRNGKRYEAETIEKLKEILKSKDEDCKLKEGEVCPKCGKSPCECKECADTKLTEASEVIDQKGFATLIKYSDPVFANASHGVLNDGNFCYKFWAKDDDEAKKIFAERGVECDESLKEDSTANYIVCAYTDDNYDYVDSWAFLKKADLDYFQLEDLQKVGDAWCGEDEDLYWSFNAKDPAIKKFNKKDALKVCELLDQTGTRGMYLLPISEKGLEARLEDKDLYEELDTESLDKLITEKLGKTYVTESGYVDGNKITIEGKLGKEKVSYVFEARRGGNKVALLGEKFALKGRLENKNIICEDIADSFKEIADALLVTADQAGAVAEDVEAAAEQIQVAADMIEQGEELESLEEATKMSEIKGTVGRIIKDKIFPRMDEISTKEELVKVAEEELAGVSDKAKGYAQEVLANLKKKNYSQAAVYLGNVMLAGENLRSPDVKKEELDEARILLTRNKVVDWLEDHEQAAEDCKHHLGVDDLQKADLNDILDWIADHETLKDDFLHRFGRGWLEEALNPNFDEEKYGKYFTQDAKGNYKLIPEKADEYFDLLVKLWKEQDNPDSKWEVRLESGKALRQAIDGEDGEEIKEALKNCYKEINRKMPEEFDEDELESMLDDLDMADFSENEEVGVDAEEAEDNVNAYLGDFYDFCDGYNIWVEI